MLDQLIESKSNSRENKSRGGFLLTTFVLVMGLCFSAVLWSLFAKDLGIGRGEFELSNLVAPLAENSPPAPKEERREQSPKTKSATITRQTNTMRIEESQPAPEKISVEPLAQKARPNGYFLIADETEGASQGMSSAVPGRETNENGTGLTQISQTAQPENVKTIEPPPVMKKATAEPAQKAKQTLVSRGVVNGKATSLPKPPYPATARAVKAGGEVSVQVMIDEAGNVVSAKAISGHPLLRDAAEKAAQNAKFKPTLLSNQPVKVSGVIVYKFSI